MENYPIVALIAMAILIVIVLVTTVSSTAMLYKKSGLAAPYIHPDKPGEFKPLGKITKLTPEQQKYRQYIINKQLPKSAP